MNANQFISGQKAETNLHRRKEILVPVDFTPGSVNAVKHALTLAEPGKTRITLLNVIEEPLTFRTLNAAGLKSSQRREREQRLARMLEHECGAPVEADVVIREGVAEEQITRMAKHQRADVIVLSQHSHRGLSQFFAHTTQRVLRNAPCQVVVLREDT